MGNGVELTAPEELALRDAERKIENLQSDIIRESILVVGDDGAMDAYVKDGYDGVVNYMSEKYGKSPKDFVDDVMGDYYENTQKYQKIASEMESFFVDNQVKQNNKARKQDLEFRVDSRNIMGVLIDEEETVRMQRVLYGNLMKHEVLADEFGTVTERGYNM